MSIKWSENDVPDQRGRVAVVTGANSGLGFEAARMLAARGAAVVLAVRDTEQGATAAARITETEPGAVVTVQQLDLACLASVRAAAADLASRYGRIDLLINNAGVMYPPREQTADGFELAFGTNHLGHFALTGLLLERLLGVPGSRVVTVSSVGHRIRARINFEDLQFERSYDRVQAYGQSKLANLMFTYELHRRLGAAGAPTLALAAHPGLADTALMRHMPVVVKVVSPVVKTVVGQPAAQGALSTMRAATDPTVRGGQYYGPDGMGEMKGSPRVVGSSRASYDEAVQRRLWAVSEELTGVTFPI